MRREVDERSPAPRKRIPTREAKDGTAGEPLSLAPPVAEQPAVVPLDLHRAFHELRELWDRGHAGDDTPKAIAVAFTAFAKACTMAEPGEIIAGARVHVEACDAARYLTALPQWLAAGGWEKLPPAKRKRVSGATARDHLPRRNGRKVDLTRLALKMGGYVEDADGHLHHPDGDEGCSFDWRASL